MFTYSHWLRLPLSTRAKIAQQFGIAKTRSVHVVQDYVQDDGYDISAVEGALNVEALQAFTGSKDKNQDVLFELMVNKIDAPAVEEVEVTELEGKGHFENDEPVTDSVKVKRTYTKRK